MHNSPFIFQVYHIHHLFLISNTRCLWLFAWADCTNEIFLIFMRIVHNLHSYIYFIYVRELLYVECIFINILNLILFYFVCQLYQV